MFEVQTREKRGLLLPGRSANGKLGVTPNIILQVCAGIGARDRKGEKEKQRGRKRTDKTWLIYLSNHKLPGLQYVAACKSPRVSTVFLFSLFLPNGGSKMRWGTEGVNVTHVCIACPTGNTIYTMQIKCVRYTHAPG